MQRTMNLGVLMALHWQRLRKPLRNCVFLLYYVPLALMIFGLNFRTSTRSLERMSLRFNGFLLSFSAECQMVMNVLWTRLTETGKDWRYVYKVSM